MQKNKYWKFLMHAPLAMVRGHLERKGEIQPGDQPIFTAEQADWRPGRGGAHNVKEMNWAKIEAIKEVGAEAHCDLLLARYRAQLRERIDRLRAEGVTTEGISAEERREIVREVADTWGVTVPAAPARSQP